MSPADMSLSKLLNRAEKAWARTGHMSDSIGLVFSESSNPDYFKQKLASDIAAYHAKLELAEQRGLILIEWDPAAGHRGQVKRIALKDGPGLACFLNVKPRWEALKSANDSLLHLSDQFTILPHLLNAWRLDRRPRGLSLQDLDKILDAVRVVQHCRESSLIDIPVRRLSARLGFDTKRIEALLPAIDLLLSDNLASTPREADELYAELGLVKHPLPIHISGPVKVALPDNTNLRITSSYLGIPPSDIHKIQIDPKARYILSVENLTTFNELAVQNAGCMVILYSNGMPSRAWRNFYAKLIEAAPPSCIFLHWGDIDGGGYRIARLIHEIAITQGKKLELYYMNPAALPSHFSGRKLGHSEIMQMQRIADSCGWDGESKGISICSLAFEQEVLDARLPS